MAAKRRARKAKGKGGRNKRSIMADVLIWRDTGASEQEIRDKLKARGCKPPRVSELIKKTRPTYAATEETRLTNRISCTSQRSAKRRRLWNVGVLRDAGPQWRRCVRFHCLLTWSRYVAWLVRTSDNVKIISTLVFKLLTPLQKD